VSLPRRVTDHAYSLPALQDDTLCVIFPIKAAQMRAGVVTTSLQICALPGFYMRNNPEERRSHLHRDGSLKPCASPCLVQVNESRWTEPHPRSPVKCPRTDTKIRNPARCGAHGPHMYRLNVHTNCTSTSGDFSSLRRGSAAARLLGLRVRILNGCLL
jgi:hypothetical protein